MRFPRALLALTACAAALAATKAPKPKKPVLTPDQRAAQSLMKSLSLHDKVAQMVIGVCYGDAPSRKSAEYRRFQHWVRDLHIGGLIVNNHVQNGLVRNAEPHAMALFLNQMQKQAKTPLIVGGDFERGVSMRVSAGSRFEGLTTAQEARALGVHWIFAPVADVNNNPDNPVIGTRSYGENP